MTAAVVLMAYGSPDRLADVPAYYADIRGGRAIAPELLEDLVDRYRRLGIEESNPLNAITEETRARLAERLGLGVFTGMKHWTPHIDEAADRAVASGADTVVGLVLAPHYSELSIAGYRDQLERGLAGRARLEFVESWHDDAGFVAFLADRIRGTDRARRLHGALAARADPRPGRPLPRPAARDLARSSRRRPRSPTGRSRSRANRRPGSRGSGPTSSITSRRCTTPASDSVLVCPVGFVSDHLEIRWDIDTEAREKAAELGMELERIEMPNAEPRLRRRPRADRAAARDSHAAGAR